MAAAHIADKALRWLALTAAAAALGQAVAAPTPTAAATHLPITAVALAACLAAVAALDSTAKAESVAQQLAAVRQVMTSTPPLKSALAGAVMASSLSNTKSSSEEIHHD